MTTHSDIGYYSHAVAKVCGIEAAAIYERIRFLITRAESKNLGRVIDGQRWVFFVVTELREEYLDWVANDKALRKALNVLEGAKLLLSRSNGHGKWYALGEVTPTILGAPQPENQDAVSGKADYPKRANRLPELAQESASDGDSDFPDRELTIYKELESTSESTSETTEESTFSSSPTPPAVAGEEEEISKSSGPSLEVDEVLIKAFADLCKWRISHPKIASYLDQLRVAHPALAPADFRAFKMYYEAMRDKRDKYEHPYPLFVADGWGRFTEWWKAHREDGVFGYLPGVEDSINLPRWAWASFEDWPVGEGVLSPRWSGVVFYAKQADGTFAEVPREQWPEWARESA